MRQDAQEVACAISCTRSTFPRPPVCLHNAKGLASASAIACQAIRRRVVKNMYEEHPEYVGRKGQQQTEQSATDRSRSRERRKAMPQSSLRSSVGGTGSHMSSLCRLNAEAVGHLQKSDAK
eukprot:5883393-Amphidinium_carterae.1